ncbi:MAG: hypothetical protein Q8R28_15980 [Dehalococcoidia bacterium]|nr:hypothetical protein [Dehalococcoidia bacterium]
MPIKGLTDNVQAAFPRIGKLRKGSPAERDEQGNVKRMGKDLDHFRFTSERPEVAGAFAEAYGDSPALVNVYLPYADAERNFSSWKERWSAGGLVHRCDGETMTLWLGSDGKHRKDPKACDGGCDEVGRLSLIIPELVRAGYVGYVTLETHGINDLLSIQASLLAAAEARVGEPHGLRGIQWTLRRVKEKISTPMPGGKRARRDKWLVKLEPTSNWVQLQLDAARNRAMKALPAPKADAERMASENQVTEEDDIDRETGEFLEGQVEDISDFSDLDPEPLSSLTPEELAAPLVPKAQDEAAMIKDARRRVLAAAEKRGWKPANKHEMFRGRFLEKAGMSLDEAPLDVLNDWADALGRPSEKAAG